MNYRTFALELKIKSSFVTPLQADTLFGSLIWSLSYLKGEEKVEEVLKAFENEPLFLLSDGFPKGYLPRPLLPLTQPVSDIENCKIQKRAKKITLMPEEVFKMIINDLSSFTLMNSLVELTHQSRFFCREVTVYKNVINRLNFSTLERGLFVQNEIYYAKDTNWVVYLAYNQNQAILSLDLIRDAFDYLSLHGYGKRKSTGKGQFEIAGFNQISLPEAKNPNAFISLSNFVPFVSDPTLGYYEVVLKYGKLGGIFAVTKPGPWKKPLRMIKAGSVFRIDGELKDYYGGLVSGIYPFDERIRHYGFAFPLGVRLG